MEQKKLRLKLKAFDHRVLDQALVDIVKAVNITGAKLRGPIPMPMKIERYTVNRSPHVDKKSREQFEIRIHSRIMVIDPNANTVNSLMSLELPSGVDVSIELMG